MDHPTSLEIARPESPPPGSETALGILHRTGDDESRTDLMQRVEVKFVAPHADLDALRHVLAANGRRLIYNEQVSTVRSVYFDDVRLSSCHENFGGVGQRRKVRLRWYDSLEPPETVFLEVKWRNNRITGKHRHQLACDAPLANRPLGFWHADLLHAAPSELIPDLLTASEPVVMVEYKREHFADPHSSLRVTLDYDLAFYDQTGRSRLSTSFPIRMDGAVLIESKTRPGASREARDFLHPLAPRISAFSKYVHACQHLGLVTD
tara:strand:- start:2588 stop:3379 length:792 start_codon:yes stop_codon:yes gene_type:complete